MSSYEQALKRPANFDQLSAQEQWAIDKELGILDWDGTDDREKKTAMPEKTDYEAREPEPRAELRLTAAKITLESNLKFYGLDAGRSDGSSCTVEFNVPEDVSPEWTREQLWTEKEKLDILVATMELAKGSFPRADYDAWRIKHKNAYDQLLKRRPKNS